VQERVGIGMNPKPVQNVAALKKRFKIILINGACLRTPTPSGSVQDFSSEKELLALTY